VLLSIIGVALLFCIRVARRSNGCTSMAFGVRKDGEITRVSARADRHCRLSHLQPKGRSGLAAISVPIQDATMSETTRPAMRSNTIRFLSLDMVQKADSGSIRALPLGASADGAYVLWTRWLKYNPPQTRNGSIVIALCCRAGHGSALLYSLLYLTGYALSLDDIKGVSPMGQQGRRGIRKRGHHAGRPRSPPGRWDRAMAQCGRHGHRRKRKLAARYNRRGHTLNRSLHVCAW